MGEGWQTVAGPRRHQEWVPWEPGPGLGREVAETQGEGGVGGVLGQAVGGSWVKPLAHAWPRGQSAADCRRARGGRGGLGFLS